jgi:hypothetical protein
MGGLSYKLLLKEYIMYSRDLHAYKAAGIQCSIMSTILTLFLILSGHSMVFGAIGCDLNDPDRDVARLFPKSTGYKAIYTSIKERGSEKLVEIVQSRLGDKNYRDYWGLYDSYTIYEIFSGKKKIGYIHGVNQKGRYGGLQIFLVLDLKGVVMDFYIQKMNNQFAAQYRDAKFGKQFVGFSIKDFDQEHMSNGETSGKVAGIKNPVPSERTDFTAILKAIKKNLILMDVFVFSAPPEQFKQEAVSK